MFINPPIYESHSHLRTSAIYLWIFSLSNHKKVLPFLGTLDLLHPGLLRHKEPCTLTFRGRFQKYIPCHLVYFCVCRYWFRRSGSGSDIHSIFVTLVMAKLKRTVQYSSSGLTVFGRYSDVVCWLIRRRNSIFFPLVSSRWCNSVHLPLNLTKDF